MNYQVQVEDRIISIDVDSDEIQINGAASPYRVEFSDGRYFLYSDQQVFELTILDKLKDGYRLSINNKVVTTSVRDHISQLLDKLGMSAGEEAVANEVMAPMPGVILKVLVQAGQEVKKGEPLLILEAMKMENLIKSPADVMIGSIKVSVGQNVEKNTSLIVFQ